MYFSANEWKLCTIALVNSSRSTENFIWKMFHFRFDHRNLFFFLLFRYALYLDIKWYDATWVVWFRFSLRSTPRQLIVRDAIFTVLNLSIVASIKENFNEIYIYMYLYVIFFLVDTKIILHHYCLWCGCFVFACLLL